MFNPLTDEEICRALCGSVAYVECLGMGECDAPCEARKGAQAQMQADAKALRGYEVSSMGTPCIFIGGEEYEALRKLAEGN